MSPQDFGTGSDADALLEALERKASNAFIMVILRTESRVVNRLEGTLMGASSIPNVYGVNKTCQETAWRAAPLWIRVPKMMAGLLLPKVIIEN